MTEGRVFGDRLELRDPVVTYFGDPVDSFALVSTEDQRIVLFPGTPDGTPALEDLQTEGLVRGDWFQFWSWSDSVVTYAVPLEVHQRTLEAVLPWPAESDCDEGSLQWSLAIRSRSGGCEPESLFLIEAPWSGGLALSITRLDRTCLEQHLECLRPGEDADGAVLAASLPTSTRRLESFDCPALGELRDVIEDMTLPLLPQNFISVDDDRLDVVVDSCWGEPVRLVVNRPEGSYWGQLDRQLHPLLWLVDRLMAVERGCLPQGGS